MCAPPAIGSSWSRTCGPTSTASRPSVQDILTNFKFRNQLDTLSRARQAGRPDREVPRPRHQPLARPRAQLRRVASHPALDNHAMGTMFEELVRRFNEANNEEAGEHWTPRDAVSADGRPRSSCQSPTRSLRHLPALRRRLRHGRHADAWRRRRSRNSPRPRQDQDRHGYLYGQEINPETLRDLQGRPPAQGRGRGRGQHQGRR